MKTLCCSVLSLLIAAFFPSGWAQPALSYTSLNSNFLDGSNRMLGWRFSVTEDVNVSAVGWFDWDGNGLNLSHEVGLWNTAGETLLTSVVIPAGTTATLDSGFRYMALGTPVTLVTGQTYIIAGYDVGVSGDPHVWDVSLSGFNAHVNGFASDPRISPEAAIGSVAGSFGFPTGTTGDARTVLMGPNFVVDVVPEPSVTTLLIGSGVLAFTFARRRLRKENGEG